VGTGAYGYLRVTSPDVPKWTKMKVFERVGKKTLAIDVGRAGSG
jgi:catalase